MKKTNIETAPEVKTASYGQSFKVKPSFKAELLKAIGDYPFNNIAGIINAINVTTIDEHTLNQVMQAIGQFPYVKVEALISNINAYIEPIIEE